MQTARLELPMVDYNRFQRVGSQHNAGVGRAFEDLVRVHFGRLGIRLQANLAVQVGVGSEKKLHRFDLVSEDPPILVECKSHTWTNGGNTPSAKLTVWNEAMDYFHVAPPTYRKVLFVLKHERKGQSLGQYYVLTYKHLIPDGVEILELNTDSGEEHRLK